MKIRGDKITQSERIWNWIASNYDASEEPFREIQGKNLKKTKKYLNIADIVLDFGCGTGNQSLGVSSDVKEVHGIDISSNGSNCKKKGT